MECINGHPNPPNQRFCGACGTTLTAGYTPQAPTGNVLIAGRGTVQIAAFGERIAARVIDLVVIIVCPMIPVTVLHWLSVPSLLFTNYIIFLGFLLLYEWVSISYAGATIGKSLMGIEVVENATGNGLAWAMPLCGNLFHSSDCSSSL